MPARGRASSDDARRAGPQALFAVDPSTGKVLSNFVRTPDIDASGAFNGKFLSSKGDKVHCALDALEANECMMVRTSPGPFARHVNHRLRTTSSTRRSTCATAPRAATRAWS